MLAAIAATRTPLRAQAAAPHTVLESSSTQWNRQDVAALPCPFSFICFSTPEDHYFRPPLVHWQRLSHHCWTQSRGCVLLRDYPPVEAGLMFPPPILCLAQDPVLIRSLLWQ
jgi:hypothetical protein